MNLTGATVVVVGLGRSGLAAARLAKARGARVIGTDQRDAAALGEQVRGVVDELIAGGFGRVSWSEADLVILSPGVPPFAALDRAARVVGELEFASTFIDFPCIAIGGTNGKSTTTLLVARILEGAGRRVFAGGNLGVPLSEAVSGPYEVGVVEVSSFQLERIETFRPQVSVLLNITEDHLDRYPNFLAYAEAKGNAFVNQGPSDVAVIPYGDELCAAQARRGAARQLTFGTAGDVLVVGDEIVEGATGRRFSSAASGLHGHHNRLNVAAAVAAARAFGVEWDEVAPALGQFSPLAHRMALVRELEGVTYFDDSKATNVGAAVTAVLGLEQARCVLIAGGRDKQGSYAPLVSALKAKGRAVVLLGEAAPLIENALSGALPVVHARDMADAVAHAKNLAQRGDAVLLSPACSSFDMYPSYAVRGEHFSELVRSLGARVDP